MKKRAKRKRKKPFFKPKRKWIPHSVSPMVLREFRSTLHNFRETFTPSHLRSPEPELPEAEAIRILKEEDRTMSMMEVNPKPVAPKIERVLEYAECVSFSEEWKKQVRPPFIVRIGRWVRDRWRWMKWFSWN